jgi:membrane protein DedA with SNARE-associated domain
VDGVLEWLQSLPVGALYAALAVVAAIENVFPPVPADTVVAFGSFLAARGHGTAAGTFLVTWLGNVAGAMGMYAAGRRFGAEWMHARLAKRSRDDLEDRLERLYGRYGLAALFLSRFIPGVRAIVPPFAGALKIPAGRAAAIMAVASAVWYGTVTIIAYKLGENWEEAAELMGGAQRVILLIVAVPALASGAYWLHRRRRQRR